MLSLIGGIIIFLVGLLVLALASALAFLMGTTGAGDMVPGLIGYSMAVTTVGLIGVLMGLLIIIFGVIMYVKPEQHVIWGVLVLILSIVSIFGLGGFILGMILGIIGGILGIVFRPTPPAMAAPMAPPMAPPPSPPQ